VILVARRRSSAANCVAASAAEIVTPRHPPIVLFEPASRRTHGARLVYPSDASLFSIGSLRLSVSCRRGRVDIRDLSFFGGAVTVAEVTVDVRATRRRARSVVKGLRVFGHVASGRRRLLLGGWGLLTVRRGGTSALVIRLLHAHGGLPDGTTVRVPFAEIGLLSAEARRHALRAGSFNDRPLKVTPRLGLRSYVFPVAGSATFGDAYGAFRADVAGNWHHGDDIFATVGTPVVAVASGTLNRVGWEPIGGWRLWVRDRLRNEFYYAHLSGYSPQALRSKRVTAGEVLGFVGNTGDAFTTPFHLHFEIHPHQLLGLAYNGAVDPTRYLDHWHHVKVAHLQRPILPTRLPAGDQLREARFVFGELLAARGLTRHPPSAPPRIRLPGHDLLAPPFAAVLTPMSTDHPTRGSSFFTLFLVALVSALALFTSAIVIFFRRRSRQIAKCTARESG
jgi:hypothetical protein